MNDIYILSQKIKEEAIRLGFYSCGIAKADFLEKEKKHLERWLADKHNGELDYMSRNKDLRLDPRKLVNNTKSVIVVTLNYYTSKKQVEGAPIIAKYAFGKDYHLVVKKKLNQLLSYIQKHIPNAEGRCFTDSAPILEHAWAERSGLGKIGKNSLLITPKGSYVFIGEILLNQTLEYDQPKSFNPCGNCTCCIDSCPTQAIVKEGVVSASRCLSFWTIEKKGELPDELNLKDRLFGCDICQEVCPWNNRAEEHNTEELKPISGILELTREEWFQLSPNEFSEQFKESSLKRAKYAGIVRNLRQLNKNNSLKA